MIQINRTYDILVEEVPFVSAMELPQEVHLEWGDLGACVPEGLMGDQVSLRQTVDHTGQQEDLELRRTALTVVETLEAE